VTKIVRVVVPPTLTVDVVVIVLVLTDTAPGTELVTVHVFCFVLAAMFERVIISMFVRSPI